MTRSTLVKDTTRDDRIRIVAEALSFGDDCGDCSLDACGIDKYYQPYIDGECELAELNMRNATRYYTTDAGPERGSDACGFSTMS